MFFNFKQLYKPNTKRLITLSSTLFYGLLFKGLVDHGFWRYLFTPGNFVPNFCSNFARNKAKLKANTWRFCFTQCSFCTHAISLLGFWVILVTWFALKLKNSSRSSDSRRREKISSIFWNETCIAIVFSSRTHLHKHAFCREKRVCM